VETGEEPGALGHSNDPRRCYRPVPQLSMDGNPI
jgi:hypothetical protein